MKEEEKRILSGMLVPLLLVILMWAVMIIKVTGDFYLSFLGIYPLQWKGLPGIITAPFIHADFSHLIANSVPMLVLGSALFYFYRGIAPRILMLIWFFTGIWIWIAAREAWHIGASGIVYGLAAFILVSGIIRKHTGLMAMALVVVFLYGSLIWGIFPEFFPNERISWEAHLFGLVAGTVMAVFYRKEGPQRRKYDWEDEEEDEDDGETGKQGDEETDKHGDDYWNITLTDEEIRNINQVYKRNPRSDNLSVN